MRGYLIMFSEVSLALDCLIKEHAEDGEEEAVEDAENGQAAVVRVGFSSYKNLNIIDITFFEPTLFLILFGFCFFYVPIFRIAAELLDNFSET